MKAIGYIRVSSEEQAKEGISLAAQEAKIRAFAELHDLDLIEVVADAGRSAKDTNREGLTKVMAAVEAGEVQAVIVYSLSRLSRRVVDTLTLIERIEAVGGSFISITENVNTKNAVGRFFVVITSAFAAMERETLAERTSAALAYKKSQGEHVGRPPFGYEIKNGRLVPIAGTAPVVDMMKVMRTNGATLQQIADELNGRGVATQRGGIWRPCTVQAVLKRAC